MTFLLCWNSTAGFFLSCTTALWFTSSSFHNFKHDWFLLTGDSVYCDESVLVQKQLSVMGISQQGVSQECALCDNPIFTARKSSRAFVMDLPSVGLLGLWAQAGMGPWAGWGKPVLLWAWGRSQGSFLVIPICLLGRSDQWLCKTRREWLWLGVQLCPGQWAGVWSLQVSAPGRTVPWSTFCIWVNLSASVLWLLSSKPSPDCYLLVCWLWKTKSCWVFILSS